VSTRYCTINNKQTVIVAIQFLLQSCGFYISSRNTVHAGFGMTSLYWLTKNKRKELDGYDCCGTISDFLTSILCQSSVVYMSPQNATSFGYFDSVKKSWNHHM